jgi:DnaJ-domain-containing protein 1
MPSPSNPSGDPGRGERSRAAIGYGAELASGTALGRGALVRIGYQLGRHAASGVLSLTVPSVRPTVVVLRRGAAICASGEPARRELTARLARAMAEPVIHARFDSGVAAYPPGAGHPIGLAGWVRSHLEAQLDDALADRLVRELAARPLVLRPDLAPDPVDEVDRRMLAAMAVPRRLDQLWPLARAPRFRLFGFVHFLCAVGAMTAEPSAAAATSSAGPAAPRRSLDPRRAAAMRLLGLEGDADGDAVKRAYRRLARTLHPDLQPDADEHRRRLLERRFAELTAAYEALT